MDGALLIFFYMNLLFLLGQLLRDNSIADIGWGLGFVLVAGWMHVFFSDEGTLLPTVVVGLWGLRLSTYLFYRSRRKGAEDWRYARWREQWGRWAIVRAYLQVFLLQGIFMWIIALPLMQRPAEWPLQWYQVAGLLLWLIGFLWEAIADEQLRRFKSDAANQGRIMREGLWKLSRHPNYFGEILLWWGVFLLTLPFGNWVVSLLSPLTITWLLARVSGVPMLEEKYADNPAYQRYVRETNALVPDVSRYWKRN